MVGYGTMTRDLILSYEIKWTKGKQKELIDETGFSFILIKLS